MSSLERPIERLLSTLLHIVSRLMINNRRSLRLIELLSFVFRTVLHLEKHSSQQD